MLTVVMFVCRKNLVLFCVFMLLAELGKSMATSPCYAICADTVDEVESLTETPAGCDDIFYDVHDESGNSYRRCGIFGCASCGTLCGRGSAAKPGSDSCNLYESVLASDADRGRLHGAGIFLQTAAGSKIRKKLEAKRDFSFYTLCAIM